MLFSVLGYDWPDTAFLIYYMYFVCKSGSTRNFRNLCSLRLSPLKIKDISEINISVLILTLKGPITTAADESLEESRFPEGCILSHCNGVHRMLSIM